MITCLTPRISHESNYELRPECTTCPFGGGKCHEKCRTMTRPAQYEFDYGRLRYALTILPGFCFDGASVPAFLWPTLGHPFSRELERAALFHDFVYHTHILDLCGAPADNRNIADCGLRDLANVDGLGWFNRVRLYEGVHVFGSPSYKQKEGTTEYFRQYGILSLKGAS